MESFNRKQSQHLMQPIARNLKAPPPPRFLERNFERFDSFESDSSNGSNATFKSNIFVANSSQKVRICHYEKGIFLFYVQQESLDSNFQLLMRQTKMINLKSLKYQPTLAMACLARHHKKIYRVAIAKLPDANHDDFMCNFVDYGFTAVVRSENLYHIPEELLSYPTFATQFSLANLKNVNFKMSTQEINYFFKEMTENRLLTLKCISQDGPPICQFCELYVNDKNVLDILKDLSISNLKFPIQKELNLKSDYSVKVCYVHSVQEFYIHLQDPDSIYKYDLMYMDLQSQISGSPIAQKIKPNQCVGVSIEGEWYRGRIIQICENHKARVEIIDFGIIEEIAFKHINLIPIRLIEIPSFAYRCSLNGFQTIVSENVSTQFDIICSDGQNERKILKINIVEFNEKSGYIVELEYEGVSPPLSINRLLLKNSRPLAETITLENARKRQNQKKDIKKDSTSPEIVRDIKSPEKNRNNSPRGRGNHFNKGTSRLSPTTNSNKNHRTYFEKPDKTESESTISSSGSKNKAKVELNINTDLKQKHQKSPDGNQSKKSVREQSSDLDSNEAESSSPKKNQKSKNSKGGNKKQEKSPLKREKSSNSISTKQGAKSEEIAEAKPTEIPKQSKNTINTDKRQLKCGWVSTLISTNEAYVHFEEHIDDLEKILDEMFAFYERQTNTLLDSSEALKVGMIYAFKSQDSNWYRCEILSIEGDYYRLRNMEYGNIETVPRMNIRPLNEKFKNYGKLVEKGYFNIKPNKEKCDESKLLNEMLTLFNEGSKELQFKIIKSYKDGFIIDPFDPESSENMIEILINNKKMAIRINEEELSTILEESKKKEVEELKKIEKETSSNAVKELPEKKVEVVKQEEAKETKVPSQPDRFLANLTALTSPNNFYLVRLDTLKQFNQLHTDIQILAPAMQPLIDFECDTFCLAQQPFDSLWYRAKIIDSDEGDQNIITVLCLDNGKTFSIDNKMCLKDMPEQLKQRAFFGIPCSLPIVIERRCEESATEFMLKMVEKEIEFKVLLSTQDLNYIEFFYDDKNITDAIIENKFGRRFEIFSSGCSYTSHINSLTDFYMQLEVDQLKLDLIASIMERQNGNFDAVVDPKMGQIVAAKYPEDDGWYRSKIESIEGNGFVVAFIDYGNSCLVKEIGMIDKSIAELPAMSKHCTIAKPKHILSFSEAAEKDFLKIAANGETVFHMNIVKPGDVYEVELFYNGKNIIDILSP